MSSNIGLISAKRLFIHYHSNFTWIKLMPSFLLMFLIFLKNVCLPFLHFNS